MYLLRRMPEGDYVAKPGLARSYTRKLADVATYNTPADAERSRCGNETVCTIVRTIAGLRVATVEG